MHQPEIDTIDTSIDSYLTLFSLGRNDAEKLNMQTFLQKQRFTRAYIDYFVSISLEKKQWVNPWCIQLILHIWCLEWQGVLSSYRIPSSKTLTSVYGMILEPEKPVIKVDNK